MFNRGYVKSASEGQGNSSRGLVIDSPGGGVGGGAGAGAGAGGGGGRARQAGWEEEEVSGHHRGISLG